MYIVVKMQGEGSNSKANWISVKLFNSHKDAHDFVVTNTEICGKYWTYCEIVQDGENIEPFYGFLD